MEYKLIYDLNDLRSVQALNRFSGAQKAPASVDAGSVKKANNASFPLLDTSKYLLTGSQSVDSATSAATRAAI